MKLYTDEGWLNIPEIIKIGTPFIFIVGARGIGKTYGAIDYVLEEDIRFMFTRRTQKQADLISIPEMSPLKSPCMDRGINYTVKKIAKDCSGIFTDEEEPHILGYTTALSTISGLRGFDASDVKIWIFDEFIPERHERAIKCEGEAFLNAYETINRNRELKGEPPLLCLCLSNANDVGNPIFTGLGLSDVAMKMQRKHQGVYINKERGITIILPQNSPISEQKKQTALYKATTGNSKFTDMAVNNAFEQEMCVGNRNIRDYKPIVRCGIMNFYQHKSSPEIYCSYHKSGSCETYDSDMTSVLQFKANNKWLLMALVKNEIVFESIELKREFERIFVHY